MSDIKERLERAANTKGMVSSNFSRDSDINALKVLCAEAAEELERISETRRKNTIKLWHLLSAKPLRSEDEIKLAKADELIRVANTARAYSSSTQLTGKEAYNAIAEQCEEEAARLRNNLNGGS